MSKQNKFEAGQGERGFIMKVGIEHLGIFTKDSAALRDWYVKTFDWKVVYDNGKGTYFLKSENGVMLEIMQSEIDGGSHDMKATGFRHLALSVSVEEFETIADKLKQNGVKVLTDAAVSAKGVGTMFFEDLDGNVLHLISRPSPL